MIRRLFLPDDEHLLREAYQWDEQRGEWYRAVDRVFNSGTEDKFVEKAHDLKNAFIGVFEKDGTSYTPSLQALFLVETPAPLFHEAHLAARRGTDSTKVVVAAVQLASDLLNMGAIQISVWIAEKNRPVKQICDRIGLTHDGVVMWKGAYKGNPIRWERYVLRRTDVMEVAA